MSETSTSAEAAPEGATVVITHRVRNDRHADYETWLKEIAALGRQAAGHLDWHIVRPIPGLSETYTIIIRFDTEANLRAWMESPTRAQQIEKVKTLLVAGDDFVVSSGLDFWFVPAGSKAKVPVRWKQCLVTWSAIYPLVLGVPLLIAPVLHYCGMPDNRYVVTLAATALIVCLMVYIVMPRYTKMIQRWLFS